MNCLTYISSVMCSQCSQLTRQFADSLERIYGTDSLSLFCLTNRYWWHSYRLC